MTRDRRATTNGRRDERGDAAFMLCLGLALFFALLGFGVVDLWGAMTAEQNLQAVAQSAATAGASGINTDQYRVGVLVLGPSAIADAQANLQDNQADLPGYVIDNAQITLNGNAITVTLTENVSSLVIEVAGKRSIPITASATAQAMTSAGT